jgi:hypothetical protein
MQKARGKSKGFAAFLAGAIVLLGIEPSVGEMKGDIELLKVVADGYEANLAKLKTWRGEAYIVSSVPTGAGAEAVHRIEKYRADFLVARTQGTVRWTWFPLEETEPDSGRQIPSRLNPTGGMSKGECVYVLFYDGYGQPGETRRLNIYGENGWPRHFQGEAFDPLRVLTQEIYPGLIEQLRYYHKRGSDMKSQGRIGREGDVVTLETDNTYEGHGRIVTRFVFDAAQGCSLKEFFTSSGSRETRWKLGYQEIAGVFVMKSISVAYVDGRDGRRSISERRATLTSVAVNAPVDESEFSLGRLGLKHGDHIKDTRTNLEYVFGTPGAGEADMPPKIVPSLVGKQLPRFDGISTDFPPDQAKDRRLLICFFDLAQRPSRYCLMQLAQQGELLARKGVMLVGVEAVQADKSALETWLAEQNIHVPVGRIRGDLERVKAAWGVRLLPWLVLTDTNHIVTAEGFALSTLDEKLGAKTERETK